MKTRKLSLFYIFAALLLISLACNKPQAPRQSTEAPAPVQPLNATSQPLSTEIPPTLESAPQQVEHVDIPSRAGGKAQVVHDQVTKEYASQKRAYGGDDFTNGRLERPFTQDMTYLPYLDIAEANMVWGKPFAYFMIRLIGSPKDSQDGFPAYGIEIDTDLDSRGDILIISTGVLTGQWSQEGVQVWEDANETVGGETAVKSDPPAGSGDGYEALLFQAGQGDNPDLGWARMDPLIDTRIEFALHRSLFQEYQKFNWRAFADSLLKDNINFDPNDRFTIEEAGSAEKASPYYPLKAFYAYDNTCIAPYNYTPVGGEPGLCEYLPPVVEAGPTGVPVPVPTQPIIIW